MRDGDEHHGIELAFGGGRHRIDFRDAVAASVQLYPQTDVFVDLADARDRDGGDVRFGVSEVSVADVVSDRPAMRFTDADGADHEVRARMLVGADGSRSLCRHQFPEEQRRQFFREYPYAWFGILCEAPPSAPELIYNHSDRGFALISQRTPTLQRMYFQCDPDTDVADWSDDRIWTELQSRVGDNGIAAARGADHLAQRAAVPLLRAGADAARPPRAGRRRRPHRPADGRQGAQPRARRRQGARREPSSGCCVAAPTARRPSTTTPGGRWSGCGRRSTSPTG